MPELEKYVETFRNNIKNEEFRKPEKLNINNNEIFKAALDLSYKDAQRTFANINQAVWQKHNGAKDDFRNTFSEKIIKIFKKENEFSPEELFDDFIGFFQERGYKVTYGQAQKVINMAFKYLYCLDRENDYRDIFDKCHMPLDSYTLEWYKRRIYPIDKSKDFKITSDDKWSTLTEEKYRKISKDISLHLKEAKIIINGSAQDLPPTPLEAEFIIWPEETMNQAVAAFNKTINGNYEKKDDYREMLKETEIYIKQLKNR